MRPLRRAGLPLLFLLAVLLARLPLLFAQLGTWYPYEVFSGTVATALLDGLRLHVPSLTVIEHIRGGPFFGLLLVPFYALLGPTAFAMKLLPLLWQAVTVALLVALGQRFFSRATAVTLGLVFLCAPPVFAKLAVLGFASHSESTLLHVLLFWQFLEITLRARTGWARYALFGLLLGFSAFFHLQALLGGLILLALLVVQAPRATLRGALPLLLAAALGASPTLLFEVGDARIVDFVLSGVETRDAVVYSTDVGELPGARSHYGWRQMARALARHGLGPLLEFSGLPVAAVKALAHVCGVALLLAVLAALWRERAGLLALPRRLLRRGEVPVSPLAFFVLHAATVLLLFMKSNLALNFWASGSGLESRRPTPMLFSLLVLAAFGLAPRPGQRRSRAAWLLLVVLCGAGAVGTAAVSRSTEAMRLMLRGECYEWMLPQIEHHAQRDPAAIVETIRQVDRGDPRFATLRFDVGLGYPAVPLETNLARANNIARNGGGLRAWHLAAVGRATGSQSIEVRRLAGSAALQALPPAERTLLLHAVGRALSGILPRDARPAAALLGRLVEGLPPDDARAVLEGYGFVVGHPYCPYRGYHRERLRAGAELPAAAAEAFFRGFGWGHRQRFVVPPEELPDGLPELDLVPPAHHQAFLDGWLGRVLPAEATVDL